MNVKFWVKFEGGPPQLWVRDSFEEFWHDLRETMLDYRNRRIEWVIREGL